MPNYFGAEFRDHPEWRNDGVIRVENEAVMSGLFRLKPPAKPRQAAQPTVIEERKKNIDHYIVSNLDAMTYFLGDFKATKRAHLQTSRSSTGKRHSYDER